MRGIEEVRRSQAAPERTWQAETIDREHLLQPFPQAGRGAGPITLQPGGVLLELLSALLGIELPRVLVYVNRVKEPARAGRSFNGLRNPLADTAEIGDLAASHCRRLAHVCRMVRADQPGTLILVHMAAESL